MPEGTKIAFLHSIISICCVACEVARSGVKRIQMWQGSFSKASRLFLLTAAAQHRCDPVVVSPHSGRLLKALIETMPFTGLIWAGESKQVRYMGPPKRRA